jgi:prephenate dehydratase
VPIENTLVGSVHDNYDLLAAHDDVRIVGETVLRIAHALIAPPGVALADVKRVHSHPVALGQCEELFRAHPGFEPIAAFNTAGAVQQVMQSGARDAAAIASKRAAALYGGAILIDGVEDHAQNFTRFLLLARADDAHESHPTTTNSGPMKTSLSFGLAHVPGALAAVLNAFAERAIDLLKIESRPIAGKPFEYAFHLDVRGDAEVEPLSSTIDRVRTLSRSLRVHGSYATR